MPKPIVLIAEELSPATVEALGPDFEVRYCDGADRAELLPALADVDAVLVRSATLIDAEALAANLGIQVFTVPIEPAHAAFEVMLAPVFEGTAAGLAEDDDGAVVRRVVHL